MNPLDQDAALAHGGNPNGVLPYGAVPPGPARHSEVGYEPELEGSSYQTAPITSLALARWTWAVAGLIIGALLGLLSATGGEWKATATLQINSSSSDPNALTSTGTSLQNEVTADPVLAAAAKALTANARFKAAGCAPVDKDTIGAGVEALWTTGTSVVGVTAYDPVTACAGMKASAIAHATAEQIKLDASSRIQGNQTDIVRALASATVGPPTSDEEKARRQALGQQAGTTQGSYLSTMQSVSVIDASVAVPSGQDRNTSALLGAAGGAFLGALAAVAAGAGRRRPHSPRELQALAPDLTVRTTVQAGELAGRVLETGRRSVVVLALPDTRFAATQLGMAIAHHLRTHGATVALVDRVADQNASSEDRLWALRRDVRRNVPANFSADLLVVVAGADEEALSLIAGQSDLLVSVVAKQRKTNLADIRRTVDSVRVSEPVVVLAR